MKKKIIRKIFLILGFLIFSISVISCGDHHDWPNYYNFEIQFDESYDPNKDVHFTISFGLHPEFHLTDSQIQLAYSKEKSDNLNDDNVTILYTITEANLENDYYYFTEKGKKIIYNFTEEFVIEKENFICKEGEITFVMYHTGNHSWQSSIGQEYLYKIEDNRLAFYHR